MSRQTSSSTGWILLVIIPVMLVIFGIAIYTFVSFANAYVENLRRIGELQGSPRVVSPTDQTKVQRMFK